MKKPLPKPMPLYQNGEVYDILDLKLVLMGLSTQGYDFEVESQDAHRLHLTCKKTNTRFVVDCISNSDWPQ